MGQSYTAELIGRARAEIDGKHIFGNGPLIEWLLTAFLARGHVLVEGPPGTGKTTTTKLLARLLSRSFKRIQFTSDMLPSDILGAQVYSPDSRDFRFIAGPLFADFILADEINRTPPRTQSALLEAMEERQVTIEGTTHKLSPHFFVLATQNPSDFEGTFPLPESQLDRFLLKIRVDHVDAATETVVLERWLARAAPLSEESLPALEVDWSRISAELAAIRVDRSLLGYITGIVGATRVHPAIAVGSGLRGGLAILNCARARAVVAGREFVIPEDVKELAPLALAHRIRLTPEARLGGTSDEGVIREILGKIEFPA